MEEQENIIEQTSQKESPEETTVEEPTQLATQQMIDVPYYEQNIVPMLNCYIEITIFTIAVLFGAICCGYLFRRF